MADESAVGPAPSGLSREQRIGFFLLLIFAVLSVSLGVLQIRNTLYAPFALSNKVPGILKDEVNTVDALRYRDTDNDGLNDFDELYVYRTSPYLADTDSDGISDKQEVNQGTDPNCAIGKDCVAPVLVEDSTLPAGSSALGAAAVEAAIGAPPPDLAQILSDPAQIRNMLLSAGVQKAALDKIKDSDLMQTVNQVLTSSTLADIQKLTNGSEASSTVKR